MISVCSMPSPPRSRTEQPKGNRWWPSKGRSPPLRWSTPASARFSPATHWPTLRTCSTRLNFATHRRLRKTTPGPTNSSPTWPPTPMRGRTTSGKRCSQWKISGSTTCWALASTRTRSTSTSPHETTVHPTKRGTKAPSPANCSSAPTWCCLRTTLTSMETGPMICRSR